MSSERRVRGETTPEKRARRLLDISDHITVATVSLDGRPWVSPLFFVPDDGYDLLWTSDRESRHSENIRATGRAAIVAYEIAPGRPVDGVYMEATVEELTDPVAIAAATEVMRRRPQPEKWLIGSVAEVSGAAPWRIYRAHPLSIEVRASATKGNKAVALRRPADFRHA